MKLWLHLILASALNAAPPIALRVSPHIAAAPATLHVSVMIPPAESNRRFVIILDGSNFYTTSERLLQGLRSPMQFIFEYRDLPSGEYTVSAILYGTGEFVTPEQIVLVN